VVAVTDAPYVEKLGEVLVVDDDPAVRELLAVVLGNTGFTVRTAEDGVAALRAVQERAPDLLVVDVMMPGLDGYGLLRTLRQQGLADTARVAFLTCKGDEPDELKAWELGCDDYIAKPFDPDRLGRRLRELLGQPAATLQERRQTELQKADVLDRLELAFNKGVR
jgi:DNA-binding response OmpR family regulator